VDHRTRSAVVTGTILVALGVFFLVTRFVPGIFDSFSWPLIVIGIGVLFLVLALATWTPGLAVPAFIVGGIGGLLFWQNATGHWESWAYAWTLIPGFVGVGIVVSELLEGRPLKALLDGGWPILISLVLFFLLGPYLGGAWKGQWWAVALIAMGVLIILRPLVTGRGKKKKEEE
jgi:hypothetical protein